MPYRAMLSRDSYWMQDVDLPIVLSTRVRLARNLAGIAFPHALSEEEAKKVENNVMECLQNLELEGEKIVYLSLAKLSPIEKKVLVEKHLISPIFSEAGTARGVALTESNKISIMVNEEDHLRIQVLMPGNCLERALQLAGEIDDHFDRCLDLAYKEKFGYLTSCPTNVGTGLRVSVMVHLPALALTNQVQQILAALPSLGLAVRGLYGEGSKAYGNIYQVSNQITLGKREEDTLTHLEAVIKQLVEHEMNAREALKKQTQILIEDKVWRARGTLENARLLTTEETFTFLSEDRLGIEMQILPKVSPGFVSLLINSLPGCLQYHTKNTLDGQALNVVRANFLRQSYTRKDG
ncbi:MAG: protein arginine kinase [Peptococcaceae bacterium]|nr:protein arginine kinase [Peptococcaceae bacterium]